MKNLKVNKKVGSLVLAGTMLTFVSFVGYGFTETSASSQYSIGNLKTYLNFNGYNNEPKGTTIYDFNCFLAENDLVPLSDARKIAENSKINGAYYVEKLSYDEESDTTFWQKITKEEMKAYTGILRISRDIDYKLYNVLIEKDGFKKKQVFGAESSSDCFVDLKDPYELDSPVEYYYLNGTKKNLVRKK